MLKKICVVFTCLFLVLNLSPMRASASYYQDEEPFKEFRFTITSDTNNAVYNYDYWVLTVKPYSYLNTSSYVANLYLIADMSYENFGTPEGVLRFYTDTYPYNTKLNSVYTGGIGSPTDYEQSIYIFSNGTLSSSVLNQTFPYNIKRTFPSSFISGFVFDNFNLDKFPTYEGANSNYVSEVILASNVDIYNQYGELLQYGNYYTLLKYFGGTLDASQITDYSGHETAPGVVVEPTTGSSSGGSSDGASQEQLETSKGIWGTVKDIFNSLASLPEKIADAIGGFFTDLKDGLLEGLKYLFVPDENPFDGTISLIHEKFGFIFQIIDIADFLLTYDFNEAPPDLSFSFPEDYRGNTRFNSFLSGLDFELLDWSVIEPYRNFIRNLIAGIAWYFYLSRLHKHLPDIINGTSGGGD